MTSTINASTTGAGGVVTTADASGILALQGAGTTGITIDASGIPTLASGTIVSSLAFNGSTSGTVTVRPAAVAGAWALTLPTTAGTNGYVLSTDGTGVTSWIATSGGGGTVTSITAGTGLSGGTITGSGTIALANTTVTAAAYGSSTSIPSFTVNAQGQLTAAAGNAVIAPAGTLSGTTLNSTVVSSSLTSVGTIATGVWNGSVIGLSYGGTGQTTKAAAFDALSPMTTAGDIILGGASGTGTRLAIGANNTVLTSNGTTASWVAGGSGSGTVNSGTSGQLTYYGATGTTVSGNANLTVSAGALTIGVAGTQAGTLLLAGGTSGTTTLAVAAAASGTLTLPSATDTLAAIAATQTLTNKRVTPRVLASTANSATPTLNTDSYDMMVITGQSVAITSFTTNLTGTPTNGQKLWIAITGTGAIAITSWGASFESSTVTLPSTTVTTNRLDVGFVWNVATSKWRCVASA